VLLTAGPTMTRVAETQRRFLTDLQFGDTVETGRRTIASNVRGLLFGGGLEADVAENIAYRAVLFHNTAGSRDVTTLAIGGVFKF
jgi:hypothetical protein